MPLPDLPDLEDRALRSLVEAYRAREGVKERMRSISEYEIARRVGMVEYSYAEYAESDERGVLRGALARLQSRGLVRATSVAGRYETFEPSDRATGSVLQQVAPLSAADPQEDGSAPGGGIEQRLDEIIRLLTSIDQHLARGR